jgi:hypothetical protein
METIANYVSQTVVSSSEECNRCSYKTISSEVNKKVKYDEKARDSVYPIST